MTIRSAASSRLLSVLSALVLGGLALSACGSSSASPPPTTTMVLQQSAPTFHVNPVATSGAQVGDTATFEAPLFQNGRVVGELSGSRTLVQTSKDLSWATPARVQGHTAGQALNLWFTTDIFYIFGKGSIQTQGERFAPENTDPTALPQIQISVAAPMAVIGGTRQFAFAHGQLNSLRHADGTYTQTFTLRLGN
ncbi:MAG: hypothetical protein WCI26_10630 [Acidimicrobiales bacterium]